MEQKRMQKNSKGITLIALVITIIVLLILAGVTIATLTGGNGILNQAGKAKDKTTEAEAIERVKVEVAGSYGTDGKIDPEQLKKNLGNITGLTYESENFSLPSTVSLNGYDIVIDAKGNVAKKITVEDAKTNGTVFEDNTTIADTYGNSITIPAGFKIASDSAKNVTGGVIIEDVTYNGTIGSQFVWIPVGIVYTNKEKTESKIITLGRYEFSEEGTESVYSGSYTEDTQSNHNESYTNAIAKDIEEFKTSTNNNHGYYLGRVEAGIVGYDTITDYDWSASNCNWANDNWTAYTGEEIQLVCKLGVQVWNRVSQNKASELSRNMYTSDKFTSDLVNSYAWDTAIVFIQEFSGVYDYSRQSGVAESAPSKLLAGCTKLKVTNDYDIQCNIYDLAGSAWEWTTETGDVGSYQGEVKRGGWIYDKYTSWRFGENSATSDEYYSFRPILYL